MALGNLLRLCLAFAVVAPMTAQAQVYWCPPLNAPYPQVKTCPVPWVLYAPAPTYRPDPYDINHSNSKG